MSYGMDGWNKPGGDLISRAAAIDAVQHAFDRETILIGFVRKVAIDALKVMPSAQPERMRGKWNITDAYPHNVYCSECYKTFAQTHWAVWEDGTLPRNFCPHCGADMRGEQDG